MQTYAVSTQKRDIDQRGSWAEAWKFGVRDIELGDSGGNVWISEVVGYRLPAEGGNRILDRGLAGPRTCSMK